MSEETIITRKTNFTVVDNGFINDPALSWKAKGILLYMMSKPIGWKYNPKGDMLKRAKDGADSLYSGIKELVSAGYISRTKNKGGFLKYHIFEDKNDNNIVDFLSQHNNQENPDQENPDQENPDQENPDVLVNTEDSNTEDSNTECSTTDSDLVALPISKQIDAVVERWNQTSFAKIIRLDSKSDRYKMLSARIKEYGIVKIMTAIDMASASDFLNGGGSKGWVMDFTWFVRPNKFPEVLEGKFANRLKPVKTSSHDLSKQDYSKDKPIIPKWMRDLEAKEVK